MSQTLLRKAEGGVAYLLSIAAIGLHLINAISAGALWRDESETIVLATQPEISDIWKNLQNNSPPILWPLLLRGFALFVGPMNDRAFRALGFCIGISLIGAIWFYFRSLRPSFPLLSLALLALSPTVIHWGDSMRAQGLGILVMLISGALIWRCVKQPEASHFLAASLGAIVSVHAYFYNAVLLLAFCTGAFAVFAFRLEWKNAALQALIGALAAFSIIPYGAARGAASSWNMLVQIPNYTFELFWLNVATTIASGGFWAAVGWLSAFVIAIVGGAAAICQPRRFHLLEGEREICIFSVVTLIVGVPGLFVFLKKLSYLTQTWYYLSLLLIAAVCTDVLIDILIRTGRARITRLTGVLLVAGATLPQSIQLARERMTNVDVVARRIQLLSNDDDIVLVNPFYLCVGFDRYYRGAARWITVPAIEQGPFVRYDLVKEKMMVRDQTRAVQSVIDSLTKTLQSGHRVFFVNGLALSAIGGPPAVLPPAPFLRGDWSAGPYVAQWSEMVAYFIRQHAIKIVSVPTRGDGRISSYENLSLDFAEGWRP